MEKQITELALVFGLAALVGVLARVLQQPLLLAYLAAGVIIAAFGFAPSNQDVLYGVFSQLGVTFLLFLIGLEINYSSLRIVGWSVVVTGVIQVALSTSGGILLGLLFGWPLTWAVYLGLLVAFASTVVVVKMLSERHELGSLHGKLAIGILLVQDIVAMLVILGITTWHSVGSSGSIGVAMAGLKVILLFAITLWIGRRIMPALLGLLGRTPELLFLVSIAWLFMVAALVSHLGLSMEIGGLIAGLAMANSAEQLHIASRMRPLRDFFLAVYFVTLGASLAGTSIAGLFWPIIFTTLFAVLVTPLIILFVLLTLGYHRRTAFFASGAISQVSEFGLVLAATGAALGHVNAQFITFATIVCMLTIAISSYSQHEAEPFYRWMQKILQRFEKASPVPTGTGKRKHYPIILMGAHRLGRAVLRSLPKKDVLVIDFDPEVIHHLMKEKFHTTYGDLSDEDVLEQISASGASLVISTAPDAEDTSLLIHHLQQAKKKPYLIVRAENDREAHLFYQLGADYVLLPHLTSGLTLGQVLANSKSRAALKKWREHDLQVLLG